jgi:hypothetical protein
MLKEDFGDIYELSDSDQEFKEVEKSIKKLAAQFKDYRSKKRKKY